MTAPSPAPRDIGTRPSPLARVLILAIRGYQHAFSWRPSSCRFWPTCSQYTLLAVEDHGAWRGLLLGARRIGRCHPWNPGGFDPVPGAGATAGTCSHPTVSEPAGRLAGAEGRNP